MLKKFFGTKSDREIKKLYPLVDDINQIFSTLENKSDEDLIVRVAELRESVIQKRQSKKDELPESMDKEERAKAILAAEQVQLNAIMPEAFAIVKETCRRMVGHSWRMLGNEVIWDMVPYDVQLVGAIILHNGKVAEMKTGEGKTLVATMPIFLNALTGRGVHVVTVNDYLAQRDSEWMGEVYKRLGLSVGAILNTMNNEKRREMYQCDITYGTNNEFGFDYLRDNMAHSPENQVQRGHAFAVVDEVDSVLIDEARTPLIISGQIDAPVDTTFKELRPDVQKLVKRQSVLVTDLVREAQKLLGEDNEDDAGLKLLQAQRGMPKHPKVMKIFQESGMIKLAHDIESNFIRDKKMHEVDEDLYFSIDEKSHIIDLTDKGRIFLAPDNPETFIIPDLGGMLTDIEQNDTLSHMEVEQKKEEAH
ncbi:MAG: DEAD/DEAH box helicase, partial [Candidatus Marinimicrobia bacterium]|nr:DEAD/DEAH box helicase [Candidatus Neomarinimicrobiota bacterium]